MNEQSILIHSEDDMLNFGRSIAKACSPGMVIFLEGELGAGKTTLVRGVLRAFDYVGAVKSPTYTLVENYELDDKQIFHFDLYRLAAAEELEYMGGRDCFQENSLSFIEWPQQGEGYLPKPDLIIEIQYQGLAQRQVKLKALTVAGKRVIAVLTEDNGP